MKVRSYGAGEKEIAVIGGTHGDEPMTAKAVEEFYSDLIEEYEEERMNGIAKFIVANEKAIEKSVRFTEADLNRSYPGEPESDTYEVALAANIMKELNSCDAILSIHSSRSAPPEFAITSCIDNPINRKTALYLPVNYFVDTGSLRKDTMDANLENTVTIEAGHQGSEKTKDFAYKSIEHFLAGHGVLDIKDVKATKTDVIEAVREIEKSHGEPHVYSENFSEVPEGEIVAEDDGVKHVATERENIPVLLSERGYNDIFGLIGREKNKLNP